MEKKLILDTQKMLKKYGDSIIIRLSKEDLEISGLKLGDIVSMRLELIK